MTVKKAIAFRSLALVLLTVAQLAAYAASAAPVTGSGKAKPAKPLTFEQALSAEVQVLRNPIARRILDNGGSIGDEQLLEVIDRAQRASQAEKLPDAVVERLEAWRKKRAVEDAYLNAPWAHGPTRVALGGPAHLAVPEGYRFLAGEAVAQLPKEISGGLPRPLLTSEDNTFAVTVGVSNTGHFAPKQLQLDADRILYRIRNRLHNPLINSRASSNMQLGMVAEPEWLEAPRHDPQKNVVSWANTQPAPEPPRMFALRLGKTWAVEMQVLAPGISETETPLETVQKLAAAVEFDPGEDFADARKNTPRSNSSMTDIIGGPEFRFVDYGAEIQRQKSWETMKSYLFRLSPIFLIVVVVIVRSLRRRSPEP